MSYCTKCGKQNSETAKFCTGCGTTLKVMQTTPATTQKDDDYEKIFGPLPKKKNISWLIVTIIALVILGAGSYFIFFNKKRSHAQETIVASVDTSVVQFPNKNNTTLSVDTITSFPAASEAVPLSPANSNLEIVITQDEVNAVAETLRKFYECENNQDISCLLNQYNFPVRRYYQLSNVSYDDLHKLFTESFTEKLAFHRITIKWDLCTIQKINENYKAVLYADYEFVRSAAPDENRSRSIQIIILLTSSHHIMEIYENQ